MSGASRPADVLVACHAEDLVTEFLSLLGRNPQEPLDVVLAGLARRVRLTPGSPATRTQAVASLLREEIAVGSSHRTRQAFTALVAPLLGPQVTVWTHCPADERRDRARVGWLTATAVQADSTVMYSVGISPHYQFLSDATFPLCAEQVRLKLDFLGTHAACLVHDDCSPRSISTEAVLACERFVGLARAQAIRMYALLHSVEREASIAVDPWDFQHSPYERERLRRTADWVSRHVAPGSGLLVEVGSCEGALTRMLLNAGHRVLACEPDQRFRNRLRAAVAERARVIEDSLEDLAIKRPVHAAAYLLIEMLYYLRDYSIVDNLSSNLLFLAVCAEDLRERVDPWLEASTAWEVVERVELIAPRVDFVCGEHAFRRKQGSVGVMCRRHRA